MPDALSPLQAPTAASLFCSFLHPPLSFSLIPLSLSLSPFLCYSVSLSLSLSVYLSLSHSPSLFIYLSLSLSFTLSESVLGWRDECHIKQVGGWTGQWAGRRSISALTLTLVLAPT